MFVKKNSLDKGFLQALSNIKDQRKLKTLNNLLCYDLKYAYRACPSQENLAVKVGVCRQTMNGMIAEFAQLGLLTKKQRWNNSCVYTMNPLFYRLREQLKDTFEVFRFSIKALLSFYLDKATLSSKTSLIFLSLTLASYVNNAPSSLSSSYEDTRARVRTREKYRHPKKGMKMDEIVITPAMRRATEVLKLTKWGQLKLLAFPDEGIAHANKALQTTKALKDPFSWFFSVVKGYCLDKNLPIDYHKADVLCLKKGMPKDARYTLEKPAAAQRSKTHSTPFEVRSINETEEYIKAAIAVESGATAAYEKAFGCKPPLPFARSVGGPCEMSDNSPEIINNLCAAYEEKA